MASDPTGSQKVFRGFLLAAELGSTRIGGNDLSSGIAGSMWREREKERESCYY